MTKLQVKWGKRFYQIEMNATYKVLGVFSGLMPPDVTLLTSVSFSRLTSVYVWQEPSLFIQCLGRFAWLPQAHVFLCGRMPPSFHIRVLQQPHLNDVLHEPSLFIHCLGSCVRLMHARVFLSKSVTGPMIITPPSTAATPPTMWAQSRHSINAPYDSCRKSSSSHTSAAGVGGVIQAQAHAKTWVKV